MHTNIFLLVSARIAHTHTHTEWTMCDWENYEQIVQFMAVWMKRTWIKIKMERERVARKSVSETGYVNVRTKQMSFFSFSFALCFSFFATFSSSIKSALEDQFYNMFELAHTRIHTHSFTSMAWWKRRRLVGLQHFINIKYVVCIVKFRDRAFASGVKTHASNTARAWGEGSIVGGNTYIIFKVSMCHFHPFCGKYFDCDSPGTSQMSQTFQTY